MNTHGNARGRKTREALQAALISLLADPVSRTRYEAQLERVDNHLIENKKYDTELFSESEIRYEFISRHASFYAIVEAWLKRDCAESEEMIARIIVRKLSV